MAHKGGDPAVEGGVSPRSAAVTGTGLCSPCVCSQSVEVIARLRDLQGTFLSN